MRTFWAIRGVKDVMMAMATATKMLMSRTKLSERVSLFLRISLQSLPARLEHVKDAFTGFFNFKHGQVRENPSIPLEIAP